MIQSVLKEHLHKPQAPEHCLLPWGAAPAQDGPHLTPTNWIPFSRGLSTNTELFIEATVLTRRSKTFPKQLQSYSQYKVLHRAGVLHIIIMLVHFHRI